MKARIEFEMPDWCSKCPLFVEGDRTRDFCAYTDHYIDYGYRKRMDTCPLVEVKDE